MSDPAYDVAIVGYGPVGAMGAYLLADAGLRVIVIDRAPDVVEIPRAVNLDGEIVRAFQRVGLGDETESLRQPPREQDEVGFVNSKHEPYFKASFPVFGQSGYRDIGFFDQPEFEHALRGWTAAQGKVAQRLGHEVTALANAGDRVVVDTRSVEDGTTERIEARYVLGCDGASSFVREALGIPWHSLGYDQDWLVVDIVVEDVEDLPFLTVQVCNPERLETYVCVKDPNRRWEFQALPGESREELLEPATIRRLLEPWLPPDRYTIRRKAVYQFHAATAERWRDGRIFLAGDAAHQTPPFLGQGLNTGMRDVVNFAWKLPLVLDGTCDEALLDTYEAERDPHARDLVDWAVSIGKLMENLAAQEAGRPMPHEVDPSSGYGQGRVVPPLHGGAIAVDQVSDESSVGLPLRQPDVSTPDGRTLRFDELLGPGFALAGARVSSLVEDLSARAREVVDRLGVRVVDLSGVEAVRGEIDRELESRAAVLVRPDRYVFGSADGATDLDTLVLSLGEKTCVLPLA